MSQTRNLRPHWLSSFFILQEEGGPAAEAAFSHPTFLVDLDIKHEAIMGGMGTASFYHVMRRTGPKRLTNSWLIYRRQPFGRDRDCALGSCYNKFMHDL
jgi:hypothetical protein